jgi:hypothetical protein
MKQTHYLTSTILTSNRLELDVPDLSIGQTVEVIVIVPELETPALPVIDRHQFLKLPLVDRQRVLAQQAEGAVADYEQDQEWRDWVNFDVEIRAET